MTLRWARTASESAVSTAGSSGYRLAKTRETSASPDTPATKVLRAGYHFSQNPVPDDLPFINVPAPAIVQSHITFGLGFQVTRKFDISLGYYKALENSGTGPFLNSGGEIPGTSVTNSLSESSIQLQFSYTTRGRVY